MGQATGELGALDETSWLGKQVIIPNYIQGASNCAAACGSFLMVPFQAWEESHRKTTGVETPTYFRTY